MSCNGKIYCLVNDTKWLHFHKNFDAEIKAAFKALIRNKFCDNSDAVTRLPKPWVDMQRKADYISKYNNFQTNTTSRFFAGNGVHFDILKVTERPGLLLLYHVHYRRFKKVTDACMQIIQSAELISPLNNPGNFEGNLLVRLKQEIANNGNGKNGNVQNAMLSRKKIVYVFAFMEAGIRLQDDAEHIGTFGESEIAMLKLLHASINLQKLGFEFRICQIPDQAEEGSESAEDESNHDESTIDASNEGEISEEVTDHNESNTEDESNQEDSFDDESTDAEFDDDESIYYDSTYSESDDDEP